MAQTRHSRHSLIQSFGFAFWGLWYAVCNERNLRIHLAAVAYVAYLARYYDFSGTEYALLALVMGFVITCELMNTAIERTVDIEAPGYSFLGKIAKDVAAGAVLVSSITSLAVSVFLFWDPDTLAVFGKDILDGLPAWLLAAAVTLFWVFWPGWRRLSRTRKKRSVK